MNAFDKCQMDLNSPALSNGLPIDIIINLSGLENQTFEECLESAMYAKVHDAQVPVLEITRIIANKKILRGKLDGLQMIALKELQILRKNE